MTDHNNLRKAILTELEDANIKLDRKMRLMELMDQAFRQHLGVFFLSNDELEQRDILNRSF